MVAFIFLKKPNKLRFTRSGRVSRCAGTPAGVLSQRYASQNRCHPERSWARILRPTKSKDLRLLFANDAMNFGDNTLDPFGSCGSVLGECAGHHEIEG
jgi:hypothetical protein